MDIRTAIDSSDFKLNDFMCKYWQYDAHQNEEGRS